MMSYPSTSKLPAWAVVLTLSLCALPWFMSRLGLSLTINITDSDLLYFLSHETSQPLPYAVHNAIKFQVVLDWISISIAILTGIFAFNHYRMTYDITTPIIGTFVIFAGVLDACKSVLIHAHFNQISHVEHTLAYLWALSRICSISLLISGISLVLFLKKITYRVRSIFIVIICILLTFAAYAIMYLLIYIVSAPPAYFPHKFISRPWDIIPLFLYFICGVFLFPRFHKHVNTLFSHAFLISMIPFVCAELYMVFGSKNIFDHYFFGAQIVLISSFIILFIGLLLDYTRTQHEKISFHESLTQTERLLRKTELMHKSIVNDAVDGIIVIDSKGRIEIFNKASEKMFGYRAKEVIGANVSCLMPSPYKEEHNGYLERYKKTGIKKAIGTGGRELPAMRKDGSIFPLMLAIHEITFQNEHKFAAILRDITGIKHFQKELIQAKELAEQANTTKSAFLATITHELRTPLTAIIGFSNVMLDGLDGPISEAQKESLSTISRAGEHLLELINNLLDISKIETGRMDLHIEKTDLSALCNSCLETIQPLAKHKNILLNKAFSQTPVWIEADATKIRQVIINLLGNAVKFTQIGEISLRTEIFDKTVVLMVKDSGIGLSQEDINKIFCDFTQIDNSISRKYEGTGLGLSISKRIVELHGGTIGVTSEENKGSTFSVYLPLQSSWKDNKTRDLSQRSTHLNNQPAVYKNDSFSRR